MLEPVRRLTGPVPVDALQLRGPARAGSGEEITALYLGNRANLGFLTRQFFSSASAHVLYRQQHPAWLSARSGDDDVDLVLTEQPPLWGWLAPARTETVIPAWVRQQIALPDEPDAPLLPRPLAKEVRRLQARHGYTLQMSDPDASLRDFYHGYYLPHVRARFGEGAVVVSERRFVQGARGQRIAQLHAGARWVAGMLVRRQGRSLRLGWFGTAGGLPQPGASEVLDALCIAHHHARGTRTVVMGNSRPCLSDGVLRYKSRFGARVLPTRFPQAELGISVRRWTPAVRDCLRRHPLISIADGAPKRVQVRADGCGLTLQPLYADAGNRLPT